MEHAQPNFTTLQKYNYLLTQCSTSGTITDTASTVNPFTSTMVIAATSKSVSYVKIQFKVAFEYTTSGTLLTNGANLFVNRK